MLVVALGAGVAAGTKARAPETTSRVEKCRRLRLTTKTCCSKQGGRFDERILLIVKSDAVYAKHCESKLSYEILADSTRDSRTPAALLSPLSTTLILSCAEFFSSWGSEPTLL